MTNLDSILKSGDITLLVKVCVVKAMVFPVVMYRCESWTIKKAENLRIDVFELWCWRRFLRVPCLGCEEIKPVNPKGNQSWIFIGRTDAEAETPIHWPPDVKNWLTGKDPDGWKDWRQEEKGMTEDEMVEWHHRLDGHEFVQATWVGDGQESIACGSPWLHKESNTTEWLNCTELRGEGGRQGKPWTRAAGFLWILVHESYDWCLRRSLNRSIELKGKGNGEQCLPVCGASENIVGFQLKPQRSTS